MNDKFNARSFRIQILHHWTNYVTDICTRIVERKFPCEERNLDTSCMIVVKINLNRPHLYFKI